MKNFGVRRSDVLRYKDLKIYDFFHLTCFILYSEDLFQFSLLAWILCHRTRKCIKYGKLTKKNSRKQIYSQQAVGKSHELKKIEEPEFLKKPQLSKLKVESIWPQSSLKFQKFFFD